MGEGKKRKEGSSPASASPNTSLYVQSDEQQDRRATAGSPEPRPHQHTWLKVGTSLIS